MLAEWCLSYAELDQELLKDIDGPRRQISAGQLARKEKYPGQDSQNEALYECPKVPFLNGLQIHPEIWVERHRNKQD